jgi:hypothetical protein
MTLKRTPATAQMALFPPAEEEMLFDVHEKRMKLQDDKDRAQCLHDYKTVNELVPEIHKLERQEQTLKDTLAGKTNR